MWTTSPPICNPPSPAYRTPSAPNEVPRRRKGQNPPPKGAIRPERTSSTRAALRGAAVPTPRHEDAGHEQQSQPCRVAAALPAPGRGPRADEGAPTRSHRRPPPTACSRGAVPAPTSGLETRSARAARAARRRRVREVQYPRRGEARAPTRSPTRRHRRPPPRACSRGAVPAPAEGARRRGGPEERGPPRRRAPARPRPPDEGGGERTGAARVPDARRRGTSRRAWRANQAVRRRRPRRRRGRGRRGPRRGRRASRGRRARAARRRRCRPWPCRRAW